MPVANTIHHYLPARWELLQHRSDRIAVVVLGKRPEGLTPTSGHLSISKQSPRSAFIEPDAPKTDV